MSPHVVENTSDNAGYADIMTVTSETPETLSPKLKRAARLKKIAAKALLNNLLTYPLYLLAVMLFPDINRNPRFETEMTIVFCIIVISALATAMVGGAYETEYRERALNNPNLSTGRALAESAVRLIGWTLITLASMVAMAVILLVTVRAAHFTGIL